MYDDIADAHQKLNARSLHFDLADRRQIERFIARVEPAPLPVQVLSGEPIAKLEESIPAANDLPRPQGQ
jgi:hypothetical protein